MNTKTVIGVLILAVVVVGGVYAFSSGTTKHDGPIKIGFVGPQTGDLASLGSVAKAAVEVATSEINAAGGINGVPLEVVYEDGGCNATIANSAAQKLMHVDKVSAIIGGACSSETSAFVKEASDNKIVTFSYCSSAPTLTGVSDYFFRNYPSDAYQGAFMADYAYTTLGARDVAILYHISEAYTPIKDIFTSRFESLGGHVALAIGAQQEARDYRTELTRLQATGAAFMYMPTYTDGGIVALTQAHNLGINAQIFGGDTWGDPNLQKAVAGFGSYLYAEAKTLTPTAEFTSKIQAQAHTDSVPPCASQAYDATYILAAALKTAGTDPDKLVTALHTTKYDGVSGHIEFDANGDLQGAEYVVKKIAHGTAVEVM